MAEAETPSEDIPDDHDVSRCWFDTAMGLDPASQFPFPFRNKYYEPESLYWRKYLAAIDDVHREGCLIQSFRNSREDGRGVPPSWYAGARTSNVGAIRKIRTDPGHTFRIYQAVENGKIFHSHIEICSAGSPGEKVSKPEKMELIHHLVECFLELEPHACPG